MKPSKKTLFSAGILLLIGIAAFFIFFSETQFSSNSSADLDKKNYKITRYERGFKPNNITIPKGAKVKFVNKTDRHFWPASNIHPSHGEYPSFDPKRALSPDESWSFKFTKTGTWKFHDHLTPYMTGQIKVVTPTQKEEKIVKDEDGNCENYECSRKTLINTLQEGGVDEAYTELANFYNKQPQFEQYCHAIAHDLGVSAYKILQEEGRDAILSSKASYCASGFYHGLMESFVGDRLSVKEAADFCDYVMKEMEGRAAEAGLQCYHGIGHGVVESLAIVRFPLQKGVEEKIADYGIKKCKQASTSSDPLYRCVSGAFNALANIYTYNQYDLQVNKEDPLWLCRKQPKKHQESCFGNFNTVLEWLYKFPKGSQFIEKIEDDEIAKESIRYLAGLTTLQFAEPRPEEAIQACRALQERLHLPCIEGFTHGFLEHGTPGEEYKQALNFCETDIMTKEERETCLNYSIGSLDGWYTEKKVTKICNSISSKYERYCKKNEENNPPNKKQSN